MDHCGAKGEKRKPFRDDCCCQGQKQNSNSGGGPEWSDQRCTLEDEMLGLDRAHEEERGGQSAPRRWALETREVGVSVPGGIQGKDRGGGRRKDKGEGGGGRGKEGRMKGFIHLDSITYR